MKFVWSAEKARQELNMKVLMIRVEFLKSLLRCFSVVIALGYILMRTERPHKERNS